MKSTVYFSGNSNILSVYMALQGRGVNPYVSTAIDFKLHNIGSGGALIDSFFNVDKNTGHVHISYDWFDKNNIAKHPDRPDTFPINGDTDAWYALFLMNSSNFHNSCVMGKYAPASLAAKGEKPVSPGFIKQVLDDYHEYIRTFLIALSALKLKIIILESPGLLPHNVHRLLSEFSARMEMIHYFEKIYIDYFIGMLEELNIPVLRMPDSCKDSNGIMLEKFRNPYKEDDYNHANGEYGLIMLDILTGYINQSVQVQ